MNAPVKTLSVAVIIVLVASAISSVDYSVSSSSQNTLQTAPYNLIDSLGNITGLPTPLITEYSVNFNESGLPTGTLWSVNVSGTVHTSHNSTIQFMLPAGIYNYSVENPLHFYTQNPAGQFSVTDHSLYFLENFNGQLSATGYANLFSSRFVNTSQSLSTNQTVFPVYGTFDSYTHHFIVLGYSNSMVYEVNQYNQSDITSFRGPSSPLAVDYNHLNGNLYILNSTTVFLYSSSGILLGSQYLGGYLISVSYNPANGQIIVGNLYGGIYFLDPATLSVLGTLSHITVFGSQSFAYNSALNQMEVINDTSPNGNIVFLNSENKPVSVVLATGTLFSIAYNAKTNSTYYIGFQNGNSNTYVLNSSGNYLIPGTGGSYGIGESQYFNSILVTNTQNATVELINATSNRVTYTIYGAGMPVLPLTAPGYPTIYVVNPMEDAVDIVTPNNFAEKVNFLEYGLSPHASWNVTMGSVTINTTGKQLTFYEIPGTYTYSVSGPSGYLSPPNGSFSVGEKELNVSLTFVKTYSVTFLETGLASGLTWGLNFSGTVSAADAGQPISLRAPNGTYSFNMTPETGYSASPATGFVVVDGNQQTVDVNFSLISYWLSFISSGLPTGTGWSMVINGVLEKTYGNSITYSAVPGIYNYTISPVKGYYPEVSSGSVHVTDSNATVNVNWLPYLYKVDFLESGLPTGMQWSVSIGGNQTSLVSDGNNATAYLQSGVYSYQFISSNMSWKGGSGSFTVNGSTVRVNLDFIPVLYKVTFIESGLVSGQYWSVMVQNSGSTASYGNSTFLYLQNGSYSYGAEASNSSYSTAAGSFNIQGTGTSVNIIFNLVQYNVTFRENGLLNGTQWGVYIPGSGNHTSTNPAFNVSLPVGGHSYSPLSVQGYNSTPGNYFNVVGNNLTFIINFTLLPSANKQYNLTIFEMGLPEEFHWAIVLNGTMQVTYPEGSFNLLLQNGTYNLSIFSIGPHGKVFRGIHNLTVKVCGADQFMYVLFYGPYVWLVVDFSFSYHSHDHHRAGHDHGDNGDNVARILVAREKP